jgi:hypothetical protein
MMGKYVGVCILVAAMLVTTITPAHAQRELNRFGLLVAEVQGKMEWCMHDVRSKGKSVVYVQSEDAVKQCATRVVQEIIDMRNAGAAVLAAPTIITMLNSLLAGGVAITTATVGWVVAAVAAVVLVIAIGICYVHEPCRAQTLNKIKFITKSVIKELQHHFSWIVDIADRIEKEVSTMLANMFKEIGHRGALTWVAVEKIGNAALKEFDKARAAINVRKDRFSRSNPIQFPTKIATDNDQRGCKSNVNSYHQVLKNRIVIFSKRSETKVETTIEGVRHKKTFMICVQKGVIVPQEVISEISHEFKNTIFPLVSHITGAVHESPTIYLMISSFKCNQDVHGFYCPDKKTNQIWGAAPKVTLFTKNVPKFRMYRDFNEKKKYIDAFLQYGSIAHEYAHMIDFAKEDKNDLHQWQNMFFLEGFARFIELEYYRKKGDVVFTHFLDKYNFENIPQLALLVSDLMYPSKKFFEDQFRAHTTDFKNSHMQTLARHQYLSIIYELGAAFMYYIKDTFCSSEKIPCRIFHTLISTNNRWETLEKEVVKKMNYKSFIRQFFEYAGTILENIS